MAKALTAQPDVMRGLVRLAAQGAPPGAGIITRRTGRQVDTIRGGVFPITGTGGTIITDAEAHFGNELVYRLVDTPTDRYIGSNRVLNPKAATGVANVTSGPSRTVTRETDPLLAPPRDAVTSFKVGPHPTAPTWWTVEDRLLLSMLPSGFGPGRWYVSGQLRYDSPDIWLWDDAKAAGSWQTVKDKGTWQQVKASNSPLAGQPFASLFATVLGPAKTTQERRRNLATDPRVVSASLWMNYAGVGGAVTASKPTSGGPTAGLPNYRRLQWTTAPTSQGGLVLHNATGARFVTEPGGKLTIGCWVRSSVAKNLTIRADYRNAADSAGVGSAESAPIAVAANTWTWIKATLTTPAGGYRAVPTVYDAPTAARWAVGNTLDGAGLLVESGETSGDYFDATAAATGPVTYAWAGTVDASASIQNVLDYPTHVVPFQILGVQAGDNGGWATFQGVVEVPAGTPANSRLAFLSGKVTREATVTWWLSTFMACPEAEALHGGAILPYFDGDTPINSIGRDPGDRLAPGYDWRALSGDAAITWQGTPNASWSQFIGPSQIFAEDTTYIGRPDRHLLPRVRMPVYLSDPVAPQLGQWFELIEMGDLSFAARQQLFDVLGRGAAIAVNQKRGWATGELQLMTYTLSEAEIAERMFESGRILYWRNPDPRFTENGWWVAIGNITQGRVGPRAAFRPERLWRVPFVRVERPEGLINASTSIDWNLVKNNYTWQQLRDMKNDWLDAALTGPGA